MFNNSAKSHLLFHNYEGMSTNGRATETTTEKTVRSTFFEYFTRAI